MIRVYIIPDGQQPYLLSFERAHISVGMAEDNDVRLQAEGVSGRHFRLRCEGAGVVLEDAGSRNGTYVNGRKVNGSQVLLSTDTIRITGFRVRVTSTDAAVDSAPDDEVPGGGAPRATEADPGAGRSEPAPEAGAGDEHEPPPGFDAPRVAGAVGPRARAFQERADAGHLLRGEELHEAWTWVHCGSRVTPAAGHRERDLVARSRAAASRGTRRRLGVMAACTAALMAGGWTARVVLAGGPGAHAGHIRQRVREFNAEVERRSRADCASKSTRLAEAAEAEAKASPEAALRQATEGLECVAGFPDMRDTRAEQVVRSLLAVTHGQVVSRGAPVTRVATDPGGRLVAWAGENGDVTVWDVTRATGTTIEGSGAARLLRISDNGERLVALGGGQVQLWNLLDPGSVPRRIKLAGRAGESGVTAVSGDGGVLVAGSAGEPRAFHLDATSPQLGGLALTGLGEPASAVTMSRDGTRVFAAAGTGVMGWRVTSRKVDRPVQYGGHAVMVTALGLARCGEATAERWLLSGDAGGEVHVVDLRGRARAKPVVLVAQGPVTAVRMAPDCRHLVAATARTLQLWDLHAAEPARTPRELLVGGPIVEVAFDGEAGERMVVATGDRLAVCDLTGSAPCAERTGHTKAVVAMDLAAAPGRAISASSDGTVRLWDIRATTGAGSLQAHPQAAVRALAVGDEGRVLSASGPDATLFRSLGVDAPMAIAELVSATGQPFRAVALSPNPMWAATAADELSLVMWRLGAERAKPSAHVVATPGRMSRLAFSDDGAWLAGVGPDVACIVAVSGTGQYICQPLPSSGELYALAFLPTTHRLAVGGADRGVVVHDLDAVFKGTGPSHQDLGKGTGVVRVLAASPDGRWVAAGGENADGRVWDLRAQSVAAQKLGGIDETIEALAFSPDGRWLAAGSGRKIYAWDLAGFAVTPTRVGHELGGTVRALVFSGDGTLLSGDTKGKLLAWDLEQSELTPRTIGAHGEMISQLGVMAGGDFVISAGAEPTLHFWPLTPRPLWEMAKQVLGPPGP